MAKFNCLLRFIVIVRHFHDGMQALGKTGGGYSEPQGCVKAPTPFSMMFYDMLTDAFSKTLDLKRLVASF